MILLKGRDVSEKIRMELEKEKEALDGYVPTLAIVRVGEKADFVSYERGATKKLESFGLNVRHEVFPDDIEHESFREEFKRINADTGVDGILLLRPLHGKIIEKEILSLISPGKDLDGISPVNIAKVFAGDESGFAPCTAEAVMEILKANGIPIAGKRATIIGRSMVVGKPLSMLLLKENATVTVCHTKTADLRAECQRADILVATAGRAKMLNGSFVKDGAVVIDVGINTDENGKLCGDVDTDTLEGIAAMATPVPGGVGVVTTAVLAKHLIRAVKSRRT